VTMFRGEPNAVSHRRAGSNEVVNHEHLLPWLYAALLQLEDVLARNTVFRYKSLPVLPLRTAQECKDSQLHYEDLTSFSYLACKHSPGSLPALRTGTNPTPNLDARIGPIRKPRASRPTTRSIDPLSTPIDVKMWERKAVIKASIWIGLRKSGKMSKKRMPFLGKSGLHAAIFIEP
jgi:hypothetical protein